MNILKSGTAMRVIFFYPGEEGTYVDNAKVTLYDSGIVQIENDKEETTAHINNCEILWKFEDVTPDGSPRFKLLKLRNEE